MMTITAEEVKKLRSLSGAPMMDCKKALAETNGDLDEAVNWLRKKGVETAGKRAGREVSEGRVVSYIHHNGKMGDMVEVNCEPDFVASTDQFEEFCKEISLQVAGMGATHVSRDEVAEDIVAKEKEVLSDQIDDSKPQEIQDKIVEGRLSKFFAEICLLEQPWIKDDSKTIEDYRAETVGVIGENIQIRRFVRFELGGED